MTTYQLWQHGILGLFAVRIQAGEVTGAAGPLNLRTAAAQAFDPAALAYDEREATLRRFVHSPEQFDFFRPWLQGRRKH